MIMVGRSYTRLVNIVDRLLVIIVNSVCVAAKPLSVDD